MGYLAILVSRDYVDGRRLELLGSEGFRYAK